MTQRISGHGVPGLRKGGSTLTPDPSLREAPDEGSSPTPVADSGAALRSNQLRSRRRHSSESPPHVVPCSVARW
jgi:hypothetical protein